MKCIAKFHAFSILMKPHDMIHL